VKIVGVMHRRYPRQEPHHVGNPRWSSRHR
jgi:hypothetical protein